MDEKEREQFRQLCKTTGISVANVLRSWIQQALKDQHIEVNVPPDARTLQLQNVSTAAASNNYDDTVIKGMLERIDIEVGFMFHKLILKDLIILKRNF